MEVISSYKGFKFELYPNEEQVKMLNNYFGCCRFVYNYFLSIQKDRYKNGEKHLSKFDMQKELTKVKKEEDKKFLSLAPNSSLQVELANLDSAFQAFFKKECGYPKYKSKYKDKLSIIFVGGKIKKKNGGFNFRIEQHADKYWIKLPKLGWVKMSKGTLPPKDMYILRVTVERTGSGRYMASAMGEVDIPQAPKTKKCVGIDMGLADMMILSDGTKFENPKFFKEMQKELSKEQKILSRRLRSHIVKEIFYQSGEKKGQLMRVEYDKPLEEMKNYQKQKIKVAKLHEKIANQRKHYIHNITMQIIRDYDVICIETLNVKGMAKNKKLSKSIFDVAWGEIIRQLEYKAKWYGKTLIKIDRWFPSSQTCSCCGHVDGKKELSVREWTCSECGTHHDRDINASINILNEGLRILKEQSNAEKGKKKKVA